MSAVTIGCRAWRAWVPFTSKGSRSLFGIIWGPKKMEDMGFGGQVYCAKIEFLGFWGEVYCYITLVSAVFGGDHLQLVRPVCRPTVVGTMFILHRPGLLGGCGTC